MSGANGKRPPLGTGGEGQDWAAAHHTTGGDSIARDASGADQKDLLAFLRGWSENGPWWPAAMEPDKAPVVQTFTDPAKLAEWLAPRIGRENLYFHVNDLSPGVDKMAEKGDVTRIRGAHVDIDPRPIEGGSDGRTPEELAAHYADEHARILRLVTDQPREGEVGWPEGLERPTVIVDSGGGFQCFWLYEDDEEVPPDLADGINRAIAALVGGDDNVANVNRIMRLPGAVNVLNKSKRAKGRTPAPTRLVWADWSRRFRVADLPAPVKPKEAKAGGAAGRVALSSDLPKVASLDDLPATVSDRTKMLISNGGDPDDPARYPSRSEVLFAVLCEMVRAEVPDDMIASVILDQDYGISAHVLEQDRPHQYAQRQIQRAHDEAIEPWLRRLNDRYTVLGNQGGKCRILEFLDEPTGVAGQLRAVVSLQSFEDFRNCYMNKWVVVGQDKDKNDVKMPVGKWWLQHEHRRQFQSLVFSPRDGEVVGPDPSDPYTRQLNLWRGFAVQPAPGDWSLMRAHIRDILANGDKASDSYIIRWMAWAVQNPDQPAEVALAFRGEMGTGKGLFGRVMARLFGQHGLHTGGTELISGRFNKHFADCCLLFADEILWDGDKKAEARMKVYLTEQTIAIEGKGADVVSWPNRLHVIISSNNDWVVPAGPHERRYAVFDVSSAQMQRKEYFKPLYAQVENGGLAAMLHDLLAMDLGDWHPRDDRPETAALADQKSRGLDPIKAAALDVLREGALPFEIGDDPRGTAARPFVPTDAFAAFISQRTRATVTWNDVSSVLKRIGAEKNRKRRPSGYVLPTLREAREAWNASPDLPKQDWDDAEDWISGDPF